MQGKTINGFTLQYLLGKGGMAEVWYAENEIGKSAAVKILDVELSHSAQVVTRFRNEAVVMVKLDHPNIRQVYGYGTIEGRPSIVMEYLDGNDLNSLMEQKRRFKEEELEKWWNQLVDALKYTHTQGIIHRDIKPSNLFLDKKGNIKLLDFGIAKVKKGITMTQSGITLGTLMYMSPEQVDDAKHIGPQTDEYSLAVTFVHLLTGKVPYNNTVSNDYRIRKSIVEVPLDLSSVPSAWRVFLAPYLEKKPEDRPALRHFEAVPLTMADMDKATGCDSPSISQSLFSKKQPERKKRWIALGIAALVVSAIAVLLLLRNSSSEPSDQSFDQIDQWLSKSEQMYDVYHFEVPLDDYVSAVDSLNVGYGLCQNALRELDEMESPDSVLFDVCKKRGDSLNSLYVNNFAAIVEKELIKLSVDEDTLAAIDRVRQIEEFDYFKQDSIGITKQDAIEKDIDFLCHAELLCFDTEGKYGFIDLSGNVVVKPQFDFAGDFSEGLARVRIGDKDNGKWGFINKLGTLVIDTLYVQEGSFQEGLAWVQKEKKGNFGYIDRSGEMVIQLQYSNIKSFSESMGGVRVRKKVGTRDVEKWGFVDKKGDTVIPPKYDEVGIFSEGLAKVRVLVKDEENKDVSRYGFMDKEENMVIEPVFLGVRDFSEGLAAVKIDSVTWGYVDKEGKMAFSLKCEDAVDFSEGLAKIKIKARENDKDVYKYGFVDKKGKWTISAKYYDARSFSEGMASVKILTKDVNQNDVYLWRYIDKKGEEKLHSSTFYLANSFSKGLAKVKSTKKDEWEFIDNRGATVNIKY